MSNGRYEPGLSFNRYREIGKGSPILTVNASLLKEPTPLHAKHAMADNEGKNCFALGDAFHKAILEPESFDKNFDEFYLMSPTLGLDTKQAAQARFLNPNHILINQEILDQIKWMRDALYKHSTIAHLLGQCSHRELTGVVEDKDYGIVRKIRIDACQGIGTEGEMWSPYLMDIKTEREIMMFGYNLRKYGYDIQGTYYLDTDAMITGRRREAFFFIVVSSTKPYCARLHYLIPERMEIARQTYTKRLAALCAAFSHQRWEAFEHETEPVPVG